MYLFNPDALVPGPALPLPHGHVIELVLDGRLVARHHLVQQEDRVLGVDGFAQLEGRLLAQLCCNVLKVKSVLIGEV